MAAITDEGWQRAFQAVKEQFEIDSLLPEQEKALQEFLGGRNVFVNLPTGYGKSLIFQCFPIAADALFERPRASSVVVVISPLRSLMEDQVLYLNELGIPAIAITDEEDPELLQQVMNGNYVLVYGSPECLLSTETWRSIFECQIFKEMLIGVAIDEAHCITQWGLSGSKKVPFRKWYGCLGELRSLIPTASRLIILTATATKATKSEILSTLHLSEDEIKFVEQSPDRPNLKYTVEYLDKNEPLQASFSTIIADLKSLGLTAPRTMIYCQTRKQCSVLFRVFEVFLGQNIFNGTNRPQNRMVEMYHAGTPTRVKEHIVGNLADDEGHIRVLISTVAFGMGVNCKKVRRVIHFGPSKSVEMYVQECGRGGRDGLPSTCVLLQNGLLSAHCDKDMKTYINNGECRRKTLIEHFGITGDGGHNPSAVKHRCCDICAENCNCGINGCPDLWSPGKTNGNIPDMTRDDDHNESRKTRVVSSSARKLLQNKLMQFQKELTSQGAVESMVNCPNVLLEFNSFHIQQIVRNCHVIYTVKDVTEVVEIWRHKYAIAVIKILHEIFGDTDLSTELPTNENESMDEQYSINSDWGQLRDDSSLNLLMDTQDLENFGSSSEFSEGCDESQSFNQAVEN